MCHKAGYFQTLTHGIWGPEKSHDHMWPPAPFSISQSALEAFGKEGRIDTDLKGMQRCVGFTFGFLFNPNEGRYTLGCPPAQDSSHHQDYSVFSRGSQPKPSFATVTGRGDNPRYTFGNSAFLTFFWWVYKVTPKFQKAFFFMTWPKRSGRYMKGLFSSNHLRKLGFSKTSPGKTDLVRIDSNHFL